MKSSVKVGVILPSRGLIFSATAEEILKNLKDIPHKFFFSHGNPIPDCFNLPTQRALKDKTITHLWFVEDDMKMPPGTLKTLLMEDANAVACDYPINTKGRGSVFYDSGGKVVFCGTGCLLVKRDVFIALRQPYFTDKVRWTIFNYGESIKLVASDNVTGDGYGLHDITFCIKLWNAGIIVKVAPLKLGQRKLISLGKAGSNNGAHIIQEWKRIVKNLRLKEVLKLPTALGAKSKLVVVDTPTGAITTSRSHADNLVKQKLATYPAKRFTIIDDSDVTI